MSRFDELNHAYDAWRSRYFEDSLAARQFGQNFADEFRKYIGAPDRLQRTAGDEGVPKYVWICKASLDEETQSFTAHAHEGGYDSVQIDPATGRWYFALAVRCEIAPTTWPKEWFPVLVFFTLSDGICHCQITTRPDGAFDLPLLDAGSWQRAFDFVVGTLLNLFSDKGHVERKEQMGFAIPAVPAPERVAVSGPEFVPLRSLMDEEDDD